MKATEPGVVADDPVCHGLCGAQPASSRLAAKRYVMRKGRMKLHPNSKSQVGFYVATEVQRFVPIEGSRRRSYFPVWENLILIKARGVIEAFERIRKHHERSQSSDVHEYKGVKGHWVFDGIVDLTPVYEELEDFSEILWTERPRVSLKTIRKRLLTKAMIESHYKRRNG